MKKIKQWNEGAHAIISATFALSFSSPPPESVVVSLLNLHPKLSAKYPRKQETKGIFVGVDAAKIETQDYRPDFGGGTRTGFIFDSLHPNGEVQRSVALSPDSIAITRQDYQRWDQTWSETREVLSLMLPVLMKYVGITSIHLHFLDRFAVFEKISDFSAKDVCRSDSRFLPSNVFDARDLWHNNHGFFEYPAQPAEHQLLNVMEAKLMKAEENNRHPDAQFWFDIQIAHRVNHGTKEAAGEVRVINSVDELLGPGNNGNGLLDAYMIEMHNRNKWLLSNVITDELCDLIKLDRPKKAK